MKLDFKAIKNQGIFKKIGAWLLFGGFLFAFIYQLQSFDWSETGNLQIYNLNYLFLAILLVGANWFFEWKKWIAGMKSINQFSDEVLQNGFYAGMIAGFISPSALGNFLGRMTAVNKSWKAKVVATTLMGNGAQFIISLTFGFLSIVLLDNLPEITKSLSLKIVLTFAVFSLWLAYYFIGKAGMLKRILARYIPSIACVSYKLRGQFLIWSAARYLVFSFQFFFLIKAFQPEITFIVLFWVWQLYLWTTLSPSLILGKLFIRETIAIFILTNAGIELPIALLASILIWLLNNAIPSLFAYIKWKRHVLVEV
jgi:hypothetical protein